MILLQRNSIGGSGVQGKKKAIFVHRLVQEYKIAVAARN
jgi:hypothetical protein